MVIPVVFRTLAIILFHRFLNPWEVPEPVETSGRLVISRGVYPIPT